MANNVNLLGNSGQVCNQFQPQNSSVEEGVENVNTVAKASLKNQNPPADLVKAGRTITALQTREPTSGDSSDMEVESRDSFTAFYEQVFERVVADVTEVVSKRFETVIKNQNSLISELSEQIQKSNEQRWEIASVSRRENEKTQGDLNDLRRDLLKVSAFNKKYYA